VTEDVERLRWLLARFRENPAKPELTAVARDLADRFTLDQLEAMASDAEEVHRVFNDLFGRVLTTAVYVGRPRSST
jgi:hypothetical protein